MKTEPTDERIIQYALGFLTANYDDNVEEDLGLTEPDLLERARNIIAATTKENTPCPVT